MSRDLDPSTIKAISQEVVRPFFAVELKFDGDETLRMWTGQGTLVLDDGTQWIGAGNLLDISSIEETAEMAVKGATITLSGVPSEVLSLALSEPYQGRVCNIYFGTFSSGSLLKETGNYILLQDGSRINVETGEKGFNQLFSGYMDQMNIDDSAETSTIELKVENRLIDLERARVARYTKYYQKSVYPNDDGLNFVEDLQNRKVPWGRSEDA
jgi:hypothetical protein